MRLGPYEILAELGRGGMGVVYRARHVELGREVALKVIGGGKAATGLGGAHVEHMPAPAPAPAPASAPAAAAADAERGTHNVERIPATRRDRAGTRAAPASDARPSDLSADALARFRREAQIAGRLSGHPDIVAVHDVGEAIVEDQLRVESSGLSVARPAPSTLNAQLSTPLAARPVTYIAMDLIEGESLERRLDVGDLPAREAAAIVERAARALHYAHEQGVIHRDVKPGNVLLGRRSGGPVESSEFRVESSAGAGPRSAERDAQPSTLNSQPRPAGVFLTDFGLARLVDAGPGAMRLTRSGVILGTPAYMAPEQVRGETLDARVDVYGLGATLYEALTGTVPFTGGATGTVLSRVLREPPRPPRRIARDVPRDLDTIVLHCLEKLPEDRYPTALALAEDLARYQRGEPLATQPLPGLVRAWRAARRHPRLAASGLAATLALLAGGGVAAGMRERSGRAAADTTRAHDAARDVEFATRVASAFDRLVARTGEAMQRLEDHWHGHTLTGVERLECLKAVDAGVAEAADACPEAGLPGAYASLARVYARQPGADLLLDAAGGPEADPFPALLRGQACVARYLVALDLRSVHLRGGEVAREPLPESAEARAAREATAAVLAPLVGRPVPPGMRHGEVYRRWLTGVHALASKRYAEAADALVDLRDEPLLAGGATYLAGLAEYHRGRYDVSADLLERLSVRQWPKAHLAAACVRLAQAAANVRDDAAGPALARAVALLDGLLGALPDLVPARVNRGVAHAVTALFQAARGGDAEAGWTAALADFDAVLALDGTDRDALEARASAAVMRARWRQDRGTSAPTDWLAALEAGNAWVAVHPRVPHARFLRAIAAVEGARARAWAPAEVPNAFARALEDLDLAVAGPDPALEIRVYRAAVRGEWAAASLGVDAEGPARVATARAELDALLAEHPDLLAAREARMHLALTEASAADAAGQDGEAASMRALADADVLVAAIPHRADLFVARASAHLMRGNARWDRGEPADEHFGKAEADTDAALKLAPGDWMARANRGLARLRLRRWAEAIGDLEIALASRLGEPQVTEWLAEARAGLAEGRGE